MPTQKTKADLIAENDDLRDENADLRETISAIYDLSAPEEDDADEASDGETDDTDEDLD